jgi:hypothetical protein
VYFQSVGNEQIGVSQPPCGPGNPVGSPETLSAGTWDIEVYTTEGSAPIQPYAVHVDVLPGAID